jgi:tetratricopeptide (TPR) repeat protein
VIWLWFGRGDGPFAKKAIDHARVLFPEDPEVLLSSATFEDMQYNRHRRERPHRVPQETRVVVQTGVVRALHDYRESIRLDPKGVEARIRLAYLLHIIDPSHVEEPLTLLQEARALEEKPPLSYLAALFTGLIEEHAGHLDEAARWYRNAIALCPRAQTARLALSHVQLDQDQRQSAQNTLRPLTGGLPTQDNICEPDPWRIYDFGQAWRFDDQIGLMRRQVREPVEESRP